MTHLPGLIEDLGLILIAAAAISLLFKRLRQPVVLGYLIAGFLVGPHFAFLPSVKDRASISIWAEIGVIFMLFGLGLEFSFKSLARIGRSAAITATIEIMAMLGIGYVAGQLLGWSTMDSLFLGGILSISSTTIIVRAFDELGLKGRGFVSLVFGVLIVEDLIAILLLVLLSSVAATRSLSGEELLASSLQLGFFMVLWFLMGIYLLPILMRRFSRLFSDELLLIVAIGLCLLMVIVASHAGFSPALGAFVMGSLLAETNQGKAIEHLIHPVRNLFSAVFFVSVGMLIDPRVLTEHYGVIAAMTAVTIAGKLLSTTAGALLSGRSLRHSVQAGMSLAQIGEFSFIIATLGITLKVTSDFLYPIAVAVSAVTTFTTPYLIRLSSPFAAWLEARLPDGLRASLVRYEAALSTSSGRGTLSLLWREYGIKVVLNSVVVIAITLAASRVALPRLGGSFGSDEPVTLAVCAFTLIAAGPFLWAVLLGGPAHATGYAPEVTSRLRSLQLGVTIVRALVGCALAAFVVGNFTSILASTGVLLAAVAALAVLFLSPFSAPLYRKIEGRFVSNLTETERAELEKRARLPELAPWNATLAELTVSADSPLVAKSLMQCGLKERFGVTIAMIERGKSRILAPTRDALLLPCDKVYVIGTDEQIVAAREVIEPTATDGLPPVTDSLGLTSLILLASDPFVGKPLRECGLREAVNGLVVGIEREGRRYLSPDSSTQLLPGDLVWIVGDRGRIRALRA